MGIDARITIEGVSYEVDPDLAGETVILWWGLFDDELYVEHLEQRYGPYAPAGGPIPLHRYRSFKKSRTQKRADRIAHLAKQLVLPGTEEELTQGNDDNTVSFPVQSFVDPDPFQELFFANALAAKRAIADYLGRALAKLTPEQMAKVNSILEKTLNKQEVMQQIKDYFQPHRGGNYAK